MCIRDRPTEVDPKNQCRQGHFYFVLQCYPFLPGYVGLDTSRFGRRGMCGVWPLFSWSYLATQNPPALPGNIYKAPHGPGSHDTFRWGQTTIASGNLIFQPPLTIVYNTFVYVLYLGFSWIRIASLIWFNLVSRCCSIPIFFNLFLRLSSILYLTARICTSWLLEVWRSSIIGGYRLNVSAVLFSLALQYLIVKSYSWMAMIQREMRVLANLQRSMNDKAWLSERISKCCPTR